METKFDLGLAIRLMKGGYKVKDSRGKVYFMEGSKVYCIPKDLFPNGKREAVRLYWDNALSEDWSVV